MLSGFLFGLDQILKYVARTNPEWIGYIWRPWIGWEYFANTGIAFSIPVPNWLVIGITPILILLLLFWFKKLFAHVSPFGPAQGKLNVYHLSLSLILFGALSNYIDRVLFGATIDYIRLFTGVINLADEMIVGGVLLLIFATKKNKCNVDLKT